MSQHPNTEELLSAYLDGELTPAEKAHIEQQLEESPTLRDQLAELKEISHQIKMLRRPYAPPELRTVVLDRLDRKLTSKASAETPKKKFRVDRLTRWGALAAVVLLLVVGRWSLNQPRNASLEVSKPEAVAFSQAEPTIAVAPRTSGDSQAIAQNEPAVSRRMGIGGATNDLASLPKLSNSQSTPSSPAQPVQVVSLSQDEIRQRIKGLEGKPSRGNSFKVPASIKDGNGETPIVVVFTVVDVMETMNQMQVLVKQEQIRSLENPSQTLKPSPSDGSQLTAVTLELEMAGPQMAAVLNGVSAFDAVMYVPKGTEARLNSNDSSPPTQSDSGSKATSERLAEGFSSGGSRKVDLLNATPIPSKPEQLTQFSFQKLAEGNHPRESLSFSGKNQSASPVPAAASSSHSIAGGVTPRSESARKSKSIMQDKKPADGKKLKPGQLAGSGSSKSPVEKADRATEAPRFRAFILLKQQAPSPAIPVKQE